MVIVGKVLVE